MRSVFCGISAVLAALAILVLSVTPPLSTGDGLTLNSGVWAHVLGYCTLCLLVCTWLRVVGLTRRPALYGVVICSVYGFVIECVQYAVPYRNFQVSDIVVNFCAALGAGLLFAIVARVFRKKGFPGDEITSQSN